MPRRGHVVPASRPVAVRGVADRLPTGRRIHQEQIDEIGVLHRKGVTFAEIGRRVGCSERTARRYAGDVKPQLRLPQAKLDRESDPGALREQLLAVLFNRLLTNQQLRDCSIMCLYGRSELGGPPSNRFLSEAERLLHDRLAKIGLLTLQHIATDSTAQRKFIREVVGDLFADYLWWHTAPSAVDGFPRSVDGEEWRPPWERPLSERAPQTCPLDLDI